MKNNAYILLTLLILTACSNVGTRDGRIKEVILNQVTKGLDKNKLQRVDSVQLTRIDSMTEKAYLYQLILDKRKIKEALEFSIKSDSELIAELRRAITMGIQYHKKTDWEDAEIPRLTKDITKSDAELEVCIHSLDSLEKLKAVADGKEFKYFYTESRVFYSFDHVNDTISPVILVNRDFTISDTTNPLLDYLKFKEEFENESRTQKAE